MNTIKITVNQKNKTYHLDLVPGQHLLSCLLDHNISITGLCAGLGSCGKCRVNIIEGEYTLKGYAGDENQVAPSECLACKCYPLTDLVVEIPEVETEFNILTTHVVLRNINKNEKNININETVEDKNKNDNEKNENDETNNFYYKNSKNKSKNVENKNDINVNKNDINKKEQKNFSLVVDLGTTTVVIQLIEEKTKNVIATQAFVNPQRQRGADVISRITCANEGNELWFHKVIIDRLSEGIRQMIWNADLTEKDLNYIVLAGNTTMLHFLRNYSVRSLGVHPFQPITLKLEKLDFQAVFDNEKLEIATQMQPKVVLLPGISTFVGADITAGLYSLNFMESDELNLFLDLGTNGEMAIGNKDGILATATAAGPAFEGGNMECGTGSIPGAISAVEIKNHKINYKTIANKAPIGICGTGVIELLAELLEHNYMDETGLLEEEYRETGVVVAISIENQKKIVLTQGDIRQMQLAKAAIHAGLDLLVKKAGVTYENIHKFYVAGGMGFHLNLNKAIRIGLLPQELEQKIEVVGNTCLSGTIKLLEDVNYEKNLKHIVKHSKYFNLANEEEFQSKFIQYMNF